MACPQESAESAASELRDAAEAIRKGRLDEAADHLEEAGREIEETADRFESQYDDMSSSIPDCDEYMTRYDMDEYVTYDSAREMVDELDTVTESDIDCMIEDAKRDFARNLDIEDEVEDGIESVLGRGQILLLNHLFAEQMRKAKRREAWVARYHKAKAWLKVQFTTFPTFNPKKEK